MADKISNAFNSGLLTEIIVIDLQKAFDTTDHCILQQHVPFLGFSNEVIDWFKFHVNIFNKCPTTTELRCQVTQGSMLGPLSFLLYINNKPQARDCHLFLYAYNRSMLYQYKDLDDINKELTRIFN